MFELNDTEEMSKSIKDGQEFFWKPLTREDLWPSFAYSKMTVLDERNESDNYHHLLFVEFCEWMGRIGFLYYDKLKEDGFILTKKRHEQMEKFLEKVIIRFKDKN